jgi:hypothetical protein
MAKTYKCFEVKENGNWKPAPLSEVRGVAGIGKIAGRRGKRKGVGSTKKSKPKKKGWF